ncbi:MAG TPA: ATP-binding protein [Candidatus Scybalocola faecigallinarum]|uniref:ATP-binding protein n=1 Tax=Candidatus Scybalocola faecigallinarum TaxID=2840941 RepID=A0A9D1JPH3_9FIRM|nr:ATP-binding protein [Candidatus Scybalocola faecigallinarum]
MLCQFTFENFKSFKNEAFLDFCAEPISEHQDSLIIDIDSEKFLPVISIYGPNGGGKSTVLEALAYLRKIVVRPIIATKANEEISDEEQKLLVRSSDIDKYHRFDKDCENQPIKFSVMFRFKENEYQYELWILKGEIVKENLYYKKIGTKKVIIVFERTLEECVIGEDIEFVSVEKVKKSLPLLSYIGAFYDIDIIDSVIHWFFSIEFIDYDNPIRDMEILIPKQDADRKLFFDMLKQMDINIMDIRIERDGEGHIKNIFTKHKIAEKIYEIPFQEESSGTRKIFSCLARINKCLQKGSVLIADELDAKLHPKLLRFIIELFTDTEKNKSGAQLLITSHDIVNMVREIFRRDEIWFCSLSPDNDSCLYSLISFKDERGKTPRKDAVYGKRYIEGLYGADPYIDKGLKWGD